MCKINNFFIIIVICFFSLNIFAHDINKENLIKINFKFTDEEKKYLEKQKILKVASLNNFAPFSFNKNGSSYGYTIEYLNLVGHHLGLKIELTNNKSYKTYLDMLKDGSLDLIPYIAINEERKKFVDFTSFNHIVYSIGFASFESKNIKSMIDLENKTVAVAKKTFLHTHLKNKFPSVKLLLTDSTESALSAVKNKKADVVIGSLPSLKYYINNNWINGFKTFKIDDLGIPLDTQMPMGVKKGNLILKSILEKANAFIPYTEVIKLKNNWFSSSETIDKNIYSNNEFKYIQNKKVIKMCIDPNWMPFEKDEKGEHIGISADFIKIIEKKISIPIEMVRTRNWSESLEFGKQRKCDIFSLIMKTEKRTKYLNFTTPYLKIPLVIATSKDEFFINDISRVIDKKFAIVKDYAFVEILRNKYPDIKLIEVDSIQSGLKMVETRKVFGFIGALSSAAFEIQRNFIGELKIAGKFNETWNLGIGVRNDDTILLSILNKAISTLSLKNEQDILNKWISVNYEKGVDYSKIWQITSVFVLVLLIILYKSRTVTNMNNKLLKANKEIKEHQEMVDKYVLILITDLKGVITHANKAYCSVTGFKEIELLNQTHSIMRHPDMKKEFFESMWSSLKNEQVWIGEIKNFTKNKEVCWLNTYIEPLYNEGEIVGYKSISENITDKKRIEELSITDKLTGLYNRLKLDEIFTSQIEEHKRYKIPFSVILLDVDDFKKINDNFGHDIGDRVLEELGNLLKTNVRATDYVGRWGGEEFIIVCKNTKSEESKVLAVHLREIVESHCFNEVGRNTISLGVSEFLIEDTFKSLFKRVDGALYEAKNNGKNIVVVK